MPVEKIVLVIQLLVEGNSIRATERITGVHRDTVLSLLKTTGAKCDLLMRNKFRILKVTDVQADEVWSFVGMRQKTANENGLGDDEGVGSAYTFTAIESRSKLIFAWHLGRRTEKVAGEFLEKVYTAIEGGTKRFQMSTDGLRAYEGATGYSVGTMVDYGQIIKIYGQSNPDEVRYSSGECIEIKKRKVIGNENEDNISTSYVERNNLTMRTSMRRFTRLTNGFSKKWENLRLALALHFAHYNFCRIHKTLRCTPAMEASITNHIWDLKELTGMK